MNRVFLGCLIGVICLFIPLLAYSQEAKKGPAVKRMKTTLEEELRKQLFQVPRVGFDDRGVTILHGTLAKSIQPPPSLSLPGRRLPTPMPASVSPSFLPRLDFGPQFLAQLKKVEADTLPWQLPADWQINKNTAEKLQVLSIALREHLRLSTPLRRNSPDEDKLRWLLFEKMGPKGPANNQRGQNSMEFPKVKAQVWRKRYAIPAIQQLLQAEDTAVRLIMVDLLANIEDDDASSALAQRALYDLSPEVRTRAITALAKRPQAQFRKDLLAGFSYPWLPVAEHAAEAIVALQITDVVPQLIPLLKMPDPRLPYIVEKGREPVYFIRELVRMEHNNNCLVCHAPSVQNEDMVRVMIPFVRKPSISSKVPIATSQTTTIYYSKPRTFPNTTFATMVEGGGDIFLRADITFLKQDFSIRQPLPIPIKLPINPRFDFMVRARPLNPAEVKNYKPLGQMNKVFDPLEHRQPILFALRALTGQDLGSTYDSWVPLLEEIEKKDSKGAEK